MSHAPTTAQTWKELLLQGEAEIAIAYHAGAVLGTAHAKTAMLRPDQFDERLRDRTVIRQLRIDPFYERIRERRPEVAKEVSLLIDQLYQRTDALCHGDFSPKNLLIVRDRPVDEPGSFTLVDYETAHVGDPTMDLGFFLSHLVLKAIKHHGRHERYLELTRALWAGYQSGGHKTGDLIARGVQHLGVCALARIDGTSPVDYLSDERLREVVRQFSRRFLWEKPGEWDAVLLIIKQELARAQTQGNESR
jgi:5-methylthioribose kinase